MSTRDPGAPLVERRIVVQGVTGSGKSTAAARLSAALGLPYHPVDDLTWRPGWVPVPGEEQRRVFDALTAADAWVLDSAYSSWADLVLARCDLVVALDYSRGLTLGRLVRRTVGRLVDRRPICGGNVESLRSVLSPDSIIRWHVRSYARKRREMRAMAMDPAAPPVLLLRTPGELDAWFERSARPGAPVPVASGVLPGRGRVGAPGQPVTSDRDGARGRRVGTLQTSPSTLRRGLLAGAVGTAALTATTYLDMALTGRPASTADQDTVRALLRRADVKAPSADRLVGLGALSGIASGLGIGVAVAVVRRTGLRLPGVVGAPLIGGLAMAATDVTMARLGVSDPRQWTPADWTRDVVPHLAYGVGVHATLDAVDRRRTAIAALPAGPVGAGAVGTDDGRPRPRRGVLGRSLVLGLATGGRSSMAGLAVARLTHRPLATLLASGAVVGEVVADKLPTTPSRLESGPLGGRLVAGAVGGAALARRAGRSVLVPALVGAVGAGLGSVAGAAWRDVTADRGWALPGALVEDVAALGLATAALR